MENPDTDFTTNVLPRLLSRDAATIRNCVEQYCTDGIRFVYPGFIVCGKNAYCSVFQLWSLVCTSNGRHFQVNRVETCLNETALKFYVELDYSFHPITWFAPRRAKVISVLDLVRDETNRLRIARHEDFFGLDWMLTLFAVNETIASLMRQIFDCLRILMGLILVKLSEALISQ